MKIDIKELVKITKTLKLLYVEDDKKARASTFDMLKNFFSDITVAIDGQDGIDKFKNDIFDLVITDINMPHMSGIEMLEIFDTEVPALILSAHNEVDGFLQSIRIGVDGYILKPLESAQFILVLKKVVDKIILKRNNEQYKKHLEEEVQIRTKELYDKLHYDDLTGLLSRYSFFKDIENIEVPIVFIIDIDKFKVINEIYGISIGSLVLKKFALFLSNFVTGTTYKIYRLSGDEFIIWDNVDVINPEKYKLKLKDFFKEIKEFRVEVEDDFISIDVTIGFSTSQNDAFESAKIALDYAKTHKKDYAMYSIAIDKRKEEVDALIWKRKIKSAIKNSKVVPVYQPIVNQKGRVVKHETLMRLIDEDNGNLILPFFFLDIAIKTRQYNELSSSIIFEALHLLSTTSHTLSFNFTYDDIKNSSFLDEIEVLLKTTSGLGKRAIFEITESQSIENYNDVKVFIRRFRSFGVKIAIDDFGSGFSNFEYILEIEPDYLKIDGSLIKNIDTDEKAYILVKAIVQFSHELGIKIIAEYVHNETIFNMLKELNVDEYQGFYFSEPLVKIGK